MKKVLFAIGCLFFVTSLFAQQMEANHKYKISNFLGLDSTRTEFEIEPFDQLSRAGYLLDLHADNTFSVFGYAFCGTGEKAFVNGTYRLIGKNKIQLSFEKIHYKNMGVETRTVVYKKKQLYHYDFATKQFKLEK